MNFDSILYPAPKPSYSVYDLSKILYIPKQIKSKTDSNILKIKNNSGITTVVSASLIETAKNN
jgi:hypothetical protein